MMRSAIGAIRKFNPGMLQSDREVIDQFVVREPELGIVLQVLRGNVDSQSCQHILVVAPRGRGKTMLLARVAAELRTDAGLSKRLLPVRVMDENHEISELADLWLETLFQLAREITTRNAKLGQELRATHASLCARWREQGIEEYARFAVLEAADQLNRQLVLMVENLQALSEHLDDDFGWKLRQVLQSEPKIILLASATSRFKSLDDAEQPFFELFRTIELQPLGTEECRRLWQAASGDAARGREIRPLEILTGGSPRLIVMVAGFARHRSLSLLMEELAILIDEHSEYFRSHIEILPATERRVYLAVIDLWRPSKSAEIAARARRGIRLVSATLGRLVARGAVIAEGGGRKRLYSAAERLYCMYYKLRREGDETAVVQHLIRFMSVFYGNAEMADLSRMLISEAVGSKTIREGIVRVAANTPQIPDALKNELQRRSGGLLLLLKPVQAHFRNMAVALEEGDLGEYFEAVEKILDLIKRIASLSGDSDEAAVPTQLLAATLCHDAAERNLEGDAKRSAAICEALVGNFATSASPTIQAMVADALIDQSAMQWELGNFEAAVETLEGVIGRFGGSEAPEVQVTVAKALVNKGTALARLEKLGEAFSALKEVGKRFESSGVPALQVQAARALVEEADLKRGIGDARAAQRTYDKVRRLFGIGRTPEVQAEVARAMVGGASMQAGIGDPEAAISATDEVTKHFTASGAAEVQIQVAEALILKGQQLEMLGDSDRARATFDQVAKKFGGSDDPELLLKVASVLSSNSVSESVLRSAQVSLSSFDQAVERFCRTRNAPDLLASRFTLLCKARLRELLGDTEGELGVLGQLIKRLGSTEMPDDRNLVAEALVRKSELLIKSGHNDAALQACEDFQRRFHALAAKFRIHLGWRMERVRIRALLAQNRHPAALDAFRSAYAQFNPQEPTMISEITAWVGELVGANVAEHDVEEILSSNPEQAGALAPLVTALRQRIGKDVRAPKEVVEVAADIHEYLNGKQL